MSAASRGRPATGEDGFEAVVTGGAGGIGAAIAAAIAARGQWPLVADLLEQGPGVELAARLGGGYARLDVGDPEQWRATAERLEAGGRLRHVFLNAGAMVDEGEVADLDLDQYRRLLRVNVDGVVFGVAALAPVLERSGGGSIVVTASLAALVGQPTAPIYSLSKHAVVGLVRSLGPKLERGGVRIAAVCPGMVDTALITERQRSSIESEGFPLLTPERVAEAALAAADRASPGGIWVCQPGREPLELRPPRVPGPRVPGWEGRTPSFARDF